MLYRGNGGGMVGDTSVLVGASHQTQGGKCSVNLPLSRNCDEGATAF